MNTKIAFYLDRPKAEKSFIFLRYHCKDGYLVYSTKISVPTSEWNEEAQETYFNKKVNAELFGISNIVEEYLLFCNRMGKKLIYRKEVRKELDERLNRPERAVKGSHFYDSLDKIIAEAEAGQLLTPKGTKYAAGTIRAMKKSKNRLHDALPHLNFSTIDLNAYNEFILYCHKQKYSLNYISALIKDWKTFMEIAYLKGWHSNMIHRHKEFKRVEEESYQVYLNEEEILALYEVELDTQIDNIIRDRYIINLYCGLRVSDMKTLHLRNIQNDILTHVNKKTGKRVMMPVHDMISTIIKRYGGKLPKQYHENVVNRYIKDIAKAAGITKLEHFSKTIGGVKQSFIKEKWEMITNHTARRSMTTNLLKHTDMQSAMPVTGMSLKTLQKYNKRSAEENAEMLKENKFFKKNY